MVFYTFTHKSATHRVLLTDCPSSLHPACYFSIYPHTVFVLPRLPTLFFLLSIFLMELMGKVGVGLLTFSHIKVTNERYYFIQMDPNTLVKRVLYYNKLLSTICRETKKYKNIAILKIIALRIPTLDRMNIKKISKLLSTYSTRKCGVWECCSHLGISIHHKK